VVILEMLLMNSILWLAPGAGCFTWQKEKGESVAKARVDTVSPLGRHAAGKCEALQGKEAVLPERAPFPAPLGTLEKRHLCLASSHV